MPESYYKVIEKEQVLSYKLPEYLEISEEQRICVELFDEILFNSIGVHLLESLVSYESHTKVKPRIK